jgi:hypothetical protein
MWLDRELAHIANYLKQPSATLRFSPRLERRYLIARARARTARRFTRFLCVS